MSAHDIGPIRTPATAPPVSDFAEILFGHLARVDQRRWAEAYLRGLLTTPGKKSVRRLATAVSSSPTAAHSLQQFLNASPWDWAPARRELTRLAEHRVPARAWSLATAVLPKRGEHSVGVHRAFVPAAGRIVNAQRGLGAFVSADGEHIPVDWHLMLPEHWTDDAQRRRRTRIPLSVHHRPVSDQAIDLVDNLRSGTTLPPPPVLADMSEHPGTDALLRGLLEREQDFVVAVPGRLEVVPTAGPAYRTPGERPSLGAFGFLRQSTLRRPQCTAAPDRAGRVTHIRTVSGTVRLPGDPAQDGTGRGVLRLFTECRPAGHRPAHLWITNLVNSRMDELFGLVRLHSGTAAAIEEMREHYGLFDFEGRSYPGWHHHMTLVSAAYAYHRMARRAVAPGAARAPARTAA
ncbi:IS701 family transposase [Streptomyces uncialis]|uniref:IS701 family transposase n=1 Tax=Streptomyces uncialis TaxID=1048205 RepID=UPI0033F449C6